MNISTVTFRDAVKQFRKRTAAGTTTSLESTTATSTTTAPSSSDETPPTAASTSSSPKKRTSTIKSVISSKAFACMVAFGIGIRIGIKSAGQTTTSTTITGRARQFPVASVLLVAMAVREVYRAIPAWAKRRPRRRRRNDKDDDTSSDGNDPNDMSSIASISLKLQALLDVASKKLTTTMAPSKMRASLYALVQLSAQVKQQQPQVRDDAYGEAGKTVDPKVVLKGYDTYFEYADWAYDEYPNEDEEQETLQERLATRNYELLRHDKTALPGRVGHYVAICKEENTVLIGVKGSSTFEDLLTDSCGLAVPYTLPAPFVKGGSTQISAHEGIYISSQRLADDLEPFIKYLVIPNGYHLRITGHSLGAAAAAMVGLLLRSRYPKLQSKGRLQVVAFASPPILDYDSALACTAFTTTIVNNADVIPRASLHNLAIMLERMKVVNGKLEAKGIVSDDFKSMKAFLKFISEGKDGEMIMSPEEIKQAMSESIEKQDTTDPDFLFVPGRVVHMYDLWTKADYKEAEKEVEMEAEDDVAAGKEMVKTAERVYEGDGTSQVLKNIELDERMVLDHLSVGYRGSINSLLL